MNNIKYRGGVVFGGAGFIGRHLDGQLRQCGGNTLSVDLVVPADGRPTLLADVRQPLRQPELLAQAAPVIYNLAATHRTPGHPEREYFATNLYGAEQVCAYARAVGTKTLVFTSSIAPYGASEPLKTEETLPLPNTPYGISKLVAEHIHRTWQAERPDERRLVIVRPGVVFGQGERGNVTRLAAALAKKRFVYPGRKDTIKACIYVKDLARLLVEMAERPEPGVFTYNFTYEPAPSIEQICAAICAVTGSAMPKLMVPGPLLRALASALVPVQGLAGAGVHPDRVRKLMVSNNISGAKLLRDGYRLEYSLEAAIRDWQQDCGNGPLV